MTSTQRERLARVPHRQASAVTFVEMPPQPGVGAFRQPVVTTACGIEIETTLTTRRDDRVRCPDCKASGVMPADVQHAFDELQAGGHTAAEMDEYRRIFDRWVTSDPDRGSATA